MSRFYKLCINKGMMFRFRLREPKIWNLDAVCYCLCAKTHISWNNEIKGTRVQNLASTPKWDLSGWVSSPHTWMMICYSNGIKRQVLRRKPEGAETCHYLRIPYPPGHLQQWCTSVIDVSCLSTLSRTWLLCKILSIWSNFLKGWFTLNWFCKIYFI